MSNQETTLTEDATKWNQKMTEFLETLKIGRSIGGGNLYYFNEKVSEIHPETQTIEYVNPMKLWTYFSADFFSKLDGLEFKEAIAPFKYL